MPTTHNKLVVFNQISLDGHFADDNDDISWAHRGPDDSEWNDFVANNASGDGALLLGRKTYQMMESFWPTEQARQMNPAVAAGMNRLQKLVFSRTLGRVSWANTTVLKGDLPSEVRRLKNEGGRHITVLGSGSLVPQLAHAGLVDEYQLVLNPVVLGTGRPLFGELAERLGLSLVRNRVFQNGNVLLCYQPRT
jgi:dihydrofolate reductase